MKNSLVLFLLLWSLTKAEAQQGVFSYTFTAKGGKAISKTVPVPLVKFNDYNTYWYVNPTNGDRHLMVNGTKDIGIIILDDRADADVDYKDKYQGDQLDILGKTTQGFYIRPDNDNGPVHIHYATFNAGEIALTFDGPACYDDPQKFNTSEAVVKGKISGSLHFYREPKYERSAIMPGCDCDPTIYAKFYDPEIGRTPSHCENALLWKVYNAVQLALHGVVPGIATEPDSKSSAPGDIIYRPTGAMIDITGPLSTIIPCDPQNPRRAVVSLSAASRPFTQDSYGLNFIQIPNLAAYKPRADNVSMLKRLMAIQDSVGRLAMAGKITSDRANKIVQAYADQMTTGQPDIKKDNMGSKLEIRVLINALHRGDAQSRITDSYYRPIIMHKIPGAAFEVDAPAVKDGDGTWLPNRHFIFFGKFNVVNSTTGIKSITPIYSATVNKLTVFNVVIMVEGGRDMVDKAIKNIDLSAIPPLIDNLKTN